MGDCATRQEAATKLNKGTVTSPNEYVTKKQVIEWGGDSASLNKYNGDYELIDYNDIKGKSNPLYCEIICMTSGMNDIDLTALLEINTDIKQNLVQINNLTTLNTPITINQIINGNTITNFVLHRIKFDDWMMNSLSRCVVGITVNNVNSLASWQFVNEDTIVILPKTTPLYLTSTIRVVFSMWG